MFSVCWRFNCVRNRKLTTNLSCTEVLSCFSTSKPRQKQRFKYPNPEKADKLPILEYTPSAESRRVYVWGLAEHGALGNQLQIKHKNKPQNYKQRPVRMHFAESQKITDVACGYGFTAIAVNTKDEQKLFGCGINTDSQIGFHSPKRDHPLDILLNPAPIELPISNHATTRVTRLAAGRAHLLVLTNHEGVFLLGNNAYGQCGRRVIEDEKYSGSHQVHNIPNLNGSVIKDVECGQDHSLMLTEGGEVFSCGWGADGQTGLGHYNSTSEPQSVLGDVQGENIVKMSCAADCVLALSDKGDVFGWGNSEYSQLPVSGDVQQINTARVLESCRRLGRVKDIASGGSFCLVLTEDGDVYAWGYGILGLGPRVDRCEQPTLIPRTLFGCNEFAPQMRVASISAGLSHMSAITDSGDLYTWGRNRYGCLGLGHVNDQFFPLRVAVGAVATKVVLGVDHSVALCRPFI